MIECQVARRETVAAELAQILITRVDIAACEFHFLSGQAVVCEEANDLRHGDFDSRCANPRMLLRFELPLKAGEFRP